MQIGDLVRLRNGMGDVGVIVELFNGWRFRVVWSNGQRGVHNKRSLEVLCK